MATTSKPKPKSRPSSGSSSTSLSLGILIGAVSAVVLSNWIPPLLPDLNALSLFEKVHQTATPSSSTSPSATTVVNDTNIATDANEPFICTPHSYSTTIISLDPLVIYLTNFITPVEASSLLSAGSSKFEPSFVQRSGQNQVYNSRTSMSAALPKDDPAVQCVLSRARQFMGTLYHSTRDDMGTPQLVRYTAGQKFDIHHDWFIRPQVSASDPARRKWNRAVSFFATLEAGTEDGAPLSEGGETWFPYVKPVEESLPPRPDLPSEVLEKMDVETRAKVVPAWREHEDGGVAFRPVVGNAIFWVNLHANGTGDERTVHAGLPFKGKGRKTAMNIWPKKYFV